MKTARKETEEQCQTSTINGWNLSACGVLIDDSVELDVSTKVFVHLQKKFIKSLDIEKFIFSIRSDVLPVVVAICRAFKIFLFRYIYLDRNHVDFFQFN